MRHDLVLRIAFAGGERLPCVVISVVTIYMAGGLPRAYSQHLAAQGNIQQACANCTASYLPVATPI